MQAEEAEQEARDMIGIYAEFARDVAAMPVLVGRKSRLESFAGADCTYTIEAMMGDRRALQVTTPLTHAACSSLLQSLCIQWPPQTTHGWFSTVGVL